MPRGLQPHDRDGVGVTMRRPLTTAPDALGTSGPDVGGHHDLADVRAARGRAQRDPFDADPAELVFPQHAPRDYRGPATLPPSPAAPAKNLRSAR